MKAFTLVLLAVSILANACILFPAPHRILYPLTVGFPEVSPWLAILNLAAMAIAFRFHRGTILFFAGCLLISMLPLIQIPFVTRAMNQQLRAPPGGKRTAPFVLLDSFRGIPDSGGEPELLPRNILFYRPAVPGPRPALIEIYGGAWQRGSPQDNNRFDRYMASQGYAVFAIDYRHAPEARFPAQIEDVRAAIALIHGNAARYNVDPDRLALCGRSAGGQLALLAAYENGPVPIRAVISFYGPTDLALGYSDVPSPDPIDVRSILEAYLGGPPSAVPDRYRAASPVTYANQRLPPTLLIHGGRDHIVKPAFARELYSKLRASGNPAYLLEIPWSEHAFDAIFSGPGNQLALYYVERFLATALESSPRVPPILTEPRQ